MTQKVTFHIRLVVTWFTMTATIMGVSGNFTTVRRLAKDVHRKKEKSKGNSVETGEGH